MNETVSGALTQAYEGEENSSGVAQRPLQTLARAYADICAGVQPWVALNEFFHEWFDYSRDQRAALIVDPIQSAPTEAGDWWRWAVFCAAAAEYLCDHSGVSCPAWATDPRYTLAEPWYAFGGPGASTAELRARLERTTPEPLRRRNILGGDRVFANKYEFAEQLREMRHARSTRRL